ncbi:predicted protein [Scheffersomyces stipitis CBS 6054]|uniref:RING-type E3 ubiquitin transferase n=1 Tax=Scheffersomyces stipitis (strain ATCC 58785 / CBS 6054 / NBRC 10063 / NRRL Y-11545) TaxID=322104 RepID=A3LV07_PICST|nr:predicted protein [Scheffersomyces stipitis CBS 6054]ABN66689.2 predicted protein [Scheffersomyces stipitis CBS 6054]
MSSSTPSTSNSTESGKNDIPRKSRVSRGPRQSKPKAGGYRRNTGNKSENAEPEEDLDESNQCIICANRIQYAALTPCNHTTCHKCTFRQRALYEKALCLICRSENDQVIFTEDIEKNYDDFSAQNFVSFDEKFRIQFTNDYVKEDTLFLLANSCPVESKLFTSFKGLCDHAKESHAKYYCLLCSKFKKAFIEELPLYTQKQLQRHQADGDGDDSGFKGHPECKHCHGKRFYSIDELNVHIRDRHERCHICDQYSPKTADYFKNYDTLYNHFKRDHYVCAVPSCVEKRFVVFREDLDLTAHMLKEHGGLAGSRGVVIGSNTRHFHSQLSSNFTEGSTRRAALAAAAFDSGSEEDDYRSIEVKKRRFEERAKHYLNYNSETVRKFTDANASFRSKRINAKELLQIYTKELFVHQSAEEHGLLFKEFMEFFPENSAFYRDLAEVAKDLQALEARESFPVLGGTNGNTFNASSWVSGGSVARTSSPLSSFPALARPTAKKTSVSSNPPIRYTTIIKKSPANKTSVTSTQASADYKPNYLSNLDKTPSATSLPVLGQNRSTSIPASISPSISSSSSRNNSSLNLADEKKFPALEKKGPKKKIIPRVNQYNIADPGQWGSASEQPAVVIPAEEDFGIVITDKRKQKMKKKQDRILFSNGI